MWIAIAVVVLIAGGASAFLLLRGRAKTQSPTTPKDPVRVAAPAAAEPKRPPVAAAPAATVRPATAHSRAPVSAAPMNAAEDLKMVCCQVDGAMHGAMPPFGKLHVTATGLLFEATSRVTSKAGDALDSSDGATTMQSLGSMEMGQFRFEIPRAATQKVQFQGSKATLYVDDAVYVLEGLGPSAGVLAGWLQANDFES